MHRQNRWLIYILSNQTLTHNEHTVQLNVKAILYVVCQHECVCPILWMCNEVAETSIQQFSIYELLTLERRDLNITPSWNNSTSFTPSPPPPLLFVFFTKASHAKQTVRFEDFRLRRKLPFFLKDHLIKWSSLLFFGVWQIDTEISSSCTCTCKQLKDNPSFLCCFLISNNTPQVNCWRLEMCNHYKEKANFGCSHVRFYLLIKWRKKHF